MSLKYCIFFRNKLLTKAVDIISYSVARLSLYTNMLSFESLSSWGLHPMQTYAADTLILVLETSKNPGYTPE